MTAFPLIDAARELRKTLEVEDFFSGQVAYVYNPLDYASEPHETYLRAFGTGQKAHLFLGMNPGPWGMAQTGVPFGEIDHVIHWMGIDGTVRNPENMHPKKPVHGFACTRSEVSGKRFWGLMKQRYPEAKNFFKDHFVANYCPLLFLDEKGRNLTPDKLPKALRDIIDAACDRHLIRTVETLRPEVLIGIGIYAEKKMKSLFGDSLRIVSILHPSPASPRANRGWQDETVQRLVGCGIWRE